MRSSRFLELAARGTCFDPRDALAIKYSSGVPVSNKPMLLSSRIGLPDLSSSSLPSDLSAEIASCPAGFASGPRRKSEMQRWYASRYV